MLKIAELGIAAKIAAALPESPFDAVLAVGPADFAYLTGASLPFYRLEDDRIAGVFWPRRGRPTCILPADWTESLRAQGWTGGIVGYDAVGPAAAAGFAAALRPLAGTGVIGIDEAALPASLGAALEPPGPADASDWLAGQRMVKTPAEIALLEQAAYRTEHGIVGACHHVMTTGSRKEKGLSEIIRLHCLERELDGMGYDMIAEAASGEHARRYWPEAPRYGIGWGRKLEPGEVVRVAMTAAYRGYVATVRRILVMGEPDAAQRTAYAGLVALREAAVAAIAPGVSCDAVHRAIRAAAATHGIRLAEAGCFGNGIGVAAVEAPYLAAGDGTAIRPGMVLVLDLAVLGPQDEIMRNTDTLVVTGAGCRVTGWNKDWREPFVASVAYGAG